MMILISILSLHSYSQSKNLKIATWNIEHLGSSGRGFPEYHGNIPARTDLDFQKIAELIKDTLNLDIVAIQEINISYQQNNRSYSNELYSITQKLGNGWRYYLANVDPNKFGLDMQNGFIYNSDKVELVSVFEMPVPNYMAGHKSLFDRVPLIGYFEATNHNLNNPGFIIVNIHLASGQNNDENHLAAMVLIEQNLNYFIGQNGISYYERDRIILGDFNDNPYRTESDGTPKYISTLYDYMKIKGYSDFVDSSFKSTRMNKNFNSIIDHFLISKNLLDNTNNNKIAKIYLPSDKSNTGLLNWRKIYSDHFPIYVDFKLK